MAISLSQQTMHYTVYYYSKSVMNTLFKFVTINRIKWKLIMTNKK